MPDAINPHVPPGRPFKNTAGLAPPMPSSLAVASRTMAFVLAVGATGWAAFCVLPLLIAGWRGFLMFAPGYIVTFGYYWRVAARPSRLSCRIIWGFSLLTQSVWLVWMGLPLLEFGQAGIDATDVGAVMAMGFVLWWFVAAAISLFGVLVDPGEQAIDHPGY